MGNILHSNAKTTPRIRKEIQGEKIMLRGMLLLLFMILNVVNLHAQVVEKKCWEDIGYDLYKCSSSYFYNFHINRGLKNLSNEYLYYVNFGGLDLSQTNFQNSDLRKANLFKANLSSANLSGANLSGAYLVRSDLSNANLSNDDLSGADLSSADLSNADLSNAQLSGAFYSENTKGLNKQRKLLMKQGAPEESYYHSVTRMDEKHMRKKFYILYAEGTAYHILREDWNKDPLGAFRITATAGLNVWESPSLSSKKLGSFDYNQVIAVYEQTAKPKSVRGKRNFWYRSKILSEGAYVDGWVFGAFVEQIEGDS